MQHDPIAPTAAAQRLELLDSLRGFALAGVLFANLTAFTLYFLLPETATLELASLGADRWLAPLHYAFVSGKFITLFSLLFGIGFALQMQRNGNSREGRQRYLRRLAVLLLIGLVHADLLWWGDILRYYAIIGLILLPLRHVPGRTLAIAGVVLAIVPHALIPLFWAVPSVSVDSQGAIYAAALAAFSGNDWTTVLHANLAINHWWVVSNWQQACWVGGCLLIGCALGQHGVLAEPERHVHFWKRMRWVLPVGLLACLGVELLDYGRLPILTAWFDTPSGQLLHRMFRDGAVLALALGYMAGFVTLFALPGARRWLRHLAPVGRMALSNYLAHSLVGVALFYGVGLGIGPRYGMPGVTAAFVLLFAAQIAISRWWLSRFRFGPVEWLWRSLTYGRWQPMRIASLQGNIATGAGA